MDTLKLPQLLAQREETIGAVERLCADAELGARALGLGPRSSAELTLNLGLRAAPTLPALDRFDGVLFEALASGGSPAGD